MVTLDNVRVCRLCGHIDAVESSGRCPSCNAFSGLVTLPRSEAERIARRYRRRAIVKRLLGVAVGVILVSAAALWVAQVFWDRGFHPPTATTQASASTAPNAWGQVRRTPQNTGFTSESAPYPHRIQWTYQTSKPLSGTPAVADGHTSISSPKTAGRWRWIDRPGG